MGLRPDSLARRKSVETEPEHGARKVAFYLIPERWGHSPEEKGPFTEGHSHFRTSGGIAVRKTQFKNLCRYQLRGAVASKPEVQLRR